MTLRTPEEIAAERERRREAEEQRDARLVEHGFTKTFTVSGDMFSASLTATICTYCGSLIPLPSSGLFAVLIPQPEDPDESWAGRHRERCTA